MRVEAGHSGRGRGEEKGQEAGLPGGRGEMGCLGSKEDGPVRDLRGNLARTRTSVSFPSLYKKEKVLGEGSMGSVMLVRSRSNNLLYAAKMIQLRRLSDDVIVSEMKNEVDMLRSLDHPHIVHLEETFLTKRQITLIMDCCTGGDLYARHPYTERQAARVVQQVLSAVNYMHERGFVHRDIKFENIMFESQASEAAVKLIDFGLSRTYRSNSKHRMRDVVGTLYSMAPEVARGSYTQACDLWSVGVVTYMLLAERMPFDTSSELSLLTAIAHARYDYRGRRWSTVSPAAMAFIDALLVVEPSLRLGAAAAVRSAWIEDFAGPAAGEKRLSRENAFEIAEGLTRFGRSSQLRRTALMVLAHHARPQELAELRGIFARFDTAQNGTISLREFRMACRELSVEHEDYRRLFEEIDMDGTGSIRYAEFLAATIESKIDLQDERLLEAFDRLDEDDSGYITVENLRALLGTQSASPAEIEDMIRGADLTSNGMIDFDEFVALMRQPLQEQLEDTDRDIRRFTSSPQEADAAGAT